MIATQAFPLIDLTAIELPSIHNSSNKTLIQHHLSK
jgi:hypothetical protein